MHLETCQRTQCDESIQQHCLSLGSYNDKFEQIVWRLGKTFNISQVLQATLQWFLALLMHMQKSLKELQ